MVSKVKLDLFKLKSKSDLVGVYEFFKAQSVGWFNDSNEPKTEFFSTTNCPLCMGTDSNEIYVIDAFSYHECRSCNAVYTRPTLRPGVLEELYSNGTYQVYQDSLVKTSLDLRKGVLEERKFGQVEALIKSEKPSLLDVGCGGASFLDVCNKNGWEVEGVDPSPTSAKTALEKYNIKVHHGDFADMDFDKQFDAITFWGVLEHMANPLSALTKVVSLLKAGGILAFEVPSADCFLSQYLRKYNFSPTRYIESGRHNIFFSKQAILKFSESLNLDLELIESNGLDLQTILMNGILNIQDVLNDLLLGDHYRVFLRKKE
ncbi:MAG: class I SAM-dependent methyltransferase [Paracoccaceae bacterium]